MPRSKGRNRRELAPLLNPTLVETARNAKQQGTIALLPWGNVFERFFDPIGLSLDDFCERMTGGWLFGYIDALRSVGICPYSSVGICPYIGPAIVFESNWDLVGALKLLYRDPDLKADVVTPRLEVMQGALRTTLYGEATDYPWGPNLIIYDIGHDMARRLSDRQSAEAYFVEVGDSLESRCV